MTKIDVFEQIDPRVSKQIEELEKEYTTAIDGTLVKINNYFNNPEMRQDEIK